MGASVFSSAKVFPVETFGESKDIELRVYKVEVVAWRTAEYGVLALVEGVAVVREGPDLGAVSR
jgi:hypothetical protein